MLLYHPNQSQTEFVSLLAFIDKYGILTNQWTWLYEVLLEVSMTKIALWIRVCADDWAAESAIKTSNDACIFNNPIIVMLQGCVGHGWLAVFREEEVYDARQLLRPTKYPSVSQGRDVVSGSLISMSTW